MKKAEVFMVLVDWIAAAISWYLFFIYRKGVELPDFTIEMAWSDRNLYLGILIIPLAWLTFWAVLGVYDHVYRKSRIQTIYLTTTGTIIGSLVLLFTVIRDDLTFAISSYYQSFLIVLIIHWVFFTVFRTLFLSFTKHLLASQKVIHYAGLLGSIAEDDFLPPVFGVIHKKFPIVEWQKAMSDDKLEMLVFREENRIALNEIIPRVIGSADSKEILLDEPTFGLLDYDYDASPSLRDPYIRLRTSPIFQWQKNIKRIIDIGISLVLSILLSPVFLWLFLRVKYSSPGPVIFKQERKGRYGTTFEILKFRSMYVHAEENGPALAQINDERCTPLGKWMRRWRLDEFPQFYNVLRGDMSLVGPRPERPYYADQLLSQNSKYALLWQVRPGITSWGQIKYGYAADLTEMMKRFRYDLLYLENMSILLDFRILFYTVIVLWQGRGR